MLTNIRPPTKYIADSVLGTPKDIPHPEKWFALHLLFYLLPITLPVTLASLKTALRTTAL